MERTRNNIKKISEVMNNEPMIQTVMTSLAERAKQNGVTADEWAEFKNRMLETMFYKMCEMIPEMQNDLALDIYEELN